MLLKSEEFSPPAEVEASGSRVSRRRLLQGLAGAAVLSSAPAFARPAYTAKAVHFNGLSLLKRSGLIGNRCGKYLASVWIKPYWVEGDTGRTRACLFQANGIDSGAIAGSTVYYDSGAPSYNLFLYARQDDENGTLWYKPNFLMPPGQWHHWLVNVDTTQYPMVKQFYLNDVPVIFATSFQDGASWLPSMDLFENIFYMPDWMVSGRTNPPIQDMADVWLGAGQSLDLSIVANRRKFITFDKKPVELGRQGKTPTGIRPTIFFSGDVEQFPDNRGTGGPFTLVGSLSNATSSPSTDQAWTLAARQR